MGAIADINTGKIIGCRKGSLAWYHEKGHLVYNKSEKGIRNSFRQDNCANYLLATIVFSLFINSLKYIALLFLLFYLGYGIYEEVWCWKYARQEFKKSKIKGTKGETK